MTEGSSPRSELQHALYSGCRQWLVLLSEFVAMHTTIDAPAQQASDVNTDISFRLRKAYFHVDAILAWPIDTLIVHVMGPEIRTALRYLEPIVSEFLQDSSSANGAIAQLERRETSSTLLNVLVHPTTQTLIRSRYRGGLAPGESILCLAELYGLLAKLTINYGVALEALADQFGRGATQELADIMAQVSDEMASAPLNELRECLDLGDSAES